MTIAVDLVKQQNKQKQPLWSFWTGSDNTGECLSGRNVNTGELKRSG